MGSRGEAPVVSRCFTALSTQIDYHAIEVGNVSHRARDNTNIMQLNNERMQ